MASAHTSYPVYARSAPVMDTVPVNIPLRNYENATPAAHPNSTLPWQSLPEIPSSAEILYSDDNADVELPQNIVKGTWGSKEDYVGAHYELLREDAVSPLRDAVATVRNHPNMNDNHNICIYENVHVTGYTFNNAGPAVKIVFSTRRARKNILWVQSKRLLPGTLVALSPADDKFQTKCFVATVAARPLTEILKNPPQVDLFFARPEDAQIDAMERWIMVEARIGYFEAYRHTLLALQRLAHEKFPLSNLLMKPMADCNVPEYVVDSPYLDLRKVFEHDNPSSRSRNVPLAVPEDNLANVSADISASIPTSALANISLADHLGDVNILGALPEIPANMLDDTQAPAFQRMLTKELAIVQGPPGTGKTHVSIIALKAILLNMKENDPPVIVTAQTNHALDQMLRHIAAFEPNFIRLGGRTKDQEKIKPRTIREVRLGSPSIKLDDDLRGRCFSNLRRLADLMRMIMKPLQEENPLRAEILRDLGVITVAQYQSLIDGADQWVHPGQDPSSKDGPIGTWLGNYKTNLSLCEPDAVHNHIETEEPVWEALGEMEAEAPRSTGDDEDYEVLSGAFFKLNVYCHPYRRRQRGKILPLSLEEMEYALAQTDLYEIPEEDRGDVYRELWKRVADLVRVEFERRFREYMVVAKDLKVGRREYDSAILRKAKVIGTTVTGFNKNRGLIASVKPRIIMLEEAAETLEGHVMSVCVESVQHLILVGDHKQLRGHCSVQELEGEPYNLAVSMFERLVENGSGFTTLRWQRRMIPEIRRLLAPIYGQLQDHADVHTRPDVPGMGGRNTWFFDHLYPESSDSNTSRCNEGEAALIVGFCSYLVLNGVRAEDITVLTFYAGQKKTVLKALRFHHDLQGKSFKVVTVDSYQGEENKIVLLSLVRNNTDNQIGFLDVENRVCVALSRAQQGFYLFGNAKVLKNNTLWNKVLGIMEKSVMKSFGRKENCLGRNLPITCSKHNTMTSIKGRIDWTTIYGGCKAVCGDTMPCGHICKIKCHPFGHSRVQCSEKCTRSLKCGHLCKETCKKECRCKYNCVRSPAPQRKSSPDGWSAYANGGCAAEDARISRKRRVANVQNAAQIEQKRLDWEVRHGLYPKTTTSATRNAKDAAYAETNKGQLIDRGTCNTSRDIRGSEAEILAAAIAKPLVEVDACSVSWSRSTANSTGSTTGDELPDIGNQGPQTPASNVTSSVKEAPLIDAPEHVSYTSSPISRIVLDEFGFGASLLD